MEHDLSGAWPQSMSENICREVTAGLAAKLDAALARALGLRLGLERPAIVSEALALRGRISSVSQGGRDWYYLDGECFFGLGPAESHMSLADGSARVALVFKRQQLDPGDAPPHPYLDAVD